MMIYTESTEGGLMMQRELKGSLYYLLANLRYPFIIFWSVMIIALAISIILDFLMDEEGFITFNFSGSIFIFGAIFGTYIVKAAIPYAIKMGATRKKLFLSVGIHLFGIAITNSLIANSLNSFLENFYGNTLGRTLTLSHFAELFMESTWVTRVVIDSSITFFLMAVAFMIGLMFYRYGLIGGFGIIGVAMVVIVFGISRGWLLDFFINILSDFSFVFFYQLFAIGLIVYLASFILLRRITV